MKTSLLCCALLGVAPSLFGESESKCFRNEGLKANETVTFKIEGGKVSGAYTVENEETKIFEFTGKLAGDTLKVVFAGNQLPNPAMKSREWKLIRKAETEILQIKFHGKNYETNKYADYLADFEACEPSYAQLAKIAKRLTGITAGAPVTAKVSLESKNDRRAFWVKLAQGQSLSVEAPGTSITSYDPKKKQDAEGGIDVFGLEKVSQSGGYLLVFSPAGEPGEREAKFTVTDGASSQ